MKKEDSEQVAIPIPVGRMIVSDDKGHTLEVTTWRGEPAVIIDGAYIFRHSILVQLLNGRTASVLKEVL